MITITLFCLVVRKIIPFQAGSMLAGVLYNTFGMRGMFLVVGVGLSSIALCYLFLYHVALKRLKTDNICKS